MPSMSRPRISRCRAGERSMCPSRSRASRCSASRSSAPKRAGRPIIWRSRGAITVILVGIPRLGPDNRNEAARFVALIDALYEHKVKLLAAADADPAQLYPKGDGRFEFERTVSRLEEMRSDAYWMQGHGTG